MSFWKMLESLKSFLSNTGKCYLISIFWILLLKTSSSETQKQGLRNSTTYRQRQIKLDYQEISNKKRKLRILRRDLASVIN